MKYAKNVVASFLLVMAVCMTAMPVLLTEPVGGQATPYYIRGFALNETGVPVVGATVVLSMTGEINTDTTTTDSLGRYTVNGVAIPVGDGDTVTITATKAGVGTGHIFHVVDFESTDPDYARNQNVTLLPAELPEVGVFNVTFFCKDADGNGIENVSINVTNALGDYVVLTTNETGRVVVELEPGLYDFTADLSEDMEGLRNQTGDFEITIADKLVTIDMARSPSLLSFFGIEVSSFCLVVGMALFAVVVGALFVGIVRRR